jgi:hypothetical protein
MENLFQSYFAWMAPIPMPTFFGSSSRMKKALVQSKFYMGQKVFIKSKTTSNLFPEEPVHLLLSGRKLAAK